MTLSPTSPPASPTCFCTPVWPCGPVRLRDHSCLTMPLQASLQNHRPTAQISGLKDKMSSTLNSYQHTHLHPPHNPRNLHSVQSLCRSRTQRHLKRSPLHLQMSLCLYICRFRQCSQDCPHRLTYTVQQWTPRLPLNCTQILSGKKIPVRVRCTHCQTLLHWTVNQYELYSSHDDPAHMGALPLSEDRACSAWDPLWGTAAAHFS